MGKKRKKRRSRATVAVRTRTSVTAKICEDSIKAYCDMIEGKTNGLNKGANKIAALAEILSIGRTTLYNIIEAYENTNKSKVGAVLLQEYIESNRIKQNTRKTGEKVNYNYRKPIGNNKPKLGFYKTEEPIFVPSCMMPENEWGVLIPLVAATQIAQTFDAIRYEEEAYEYNPNSGEEELKPLYSSMKRLMDKYITEYNKESTRYIKGFVKIKPTYFCSQEIEPGKQYEISIKEMGK